MNLSCGSRTIKYLMFAFNLFFVITGIIIIAVGATVKTLYSEYSYFLDDKYFSLPNLLIATGALIFVISFFGCCGAIKESWILLGVFSVLLIIIFIFEFSAGIAGYVLRDRTLNYLDTTLKENLKMYTSTSMASWDLIQSKFHCCGVDSYADWYPIFHNNSLPVSCCPSTAGVIGAFYCNANPTTISTASTTVLPTTTSHSTTASSESTTGSSSSGPPSTISTEITSSSTSIPTTGTNPHKAESLLDTQNSEQNSAVRRRRAAESANATVPSTTDPYITGCKIAFGNYIKKHAVQIGACTFALAVIQILGIVFSCHLVRQLKNGYYST